MSKISPNHVALVLFGLIILTNLVLINFSRTWVISSSNSVAAINNQEERTQGLWQKCNLMLSTGTSQCNELFPGYRIQNLPTYLAFSRCAIPLSIIAVFVATVCSILGNPVLNCCKVSQKMVTNITAGTFLLAGILSLISFSWYTNAAMNNYITLKGAQLSGIGLNISQWDLGWAMWLGFFTAIFAVVGSIHAMMTARKCSDSDEFQMAPKHEQQAFTGGRHDPTFV